MSVDNMNEENERETQSYGSLLLCVDYNTLHFKNFAQYKHSLPFSILVNIKKKLSQKLKTSPTSHFIHKLHHQLHRQPHSREPTLYYWWCFSHVRCQ